MLPVAARGVEIKAFHDDASGLFDEVFRRGLNRIAAVSHSGYLVCPKRPVRGSQLQDSQPIVLR